MIKQLFFLVLGLVIIVFIGAIFLQMMHPTLLSKKEYGEKFSECAAELREKGAGELGTAAESLYSACSGSGGCFKECGSACEKETYTKGELRIFFWLSQNNPFGKTECTQECVPTCLCPYEKPFWGEKGCTR